MIVIGVTGGVASGKSLVADMFRRLGAKKIDGDQAGHVVLGRMDVREALRKRWGQDVMDSNGQIERAQVATIVFGPAPRGPEELEFLEKLTHPEIYALLEEQVQAYRSAGHPATVLDAAVMFKAGWDRLCDKIVFVDATRAIRRARARKRGWSDEEFARREAAQEPLSLKRDRADAAINNSGPLAATQAQVRQIWQTILG